MLKSAFGRLSTGVCRQPQWAYVGVFMYSLAGWRRFYGMLFPVDYAPACADSRSGLMSGCLCIHWPGGAGSTIGNVSYNSRGDALTTVYGFLRGLLFAISATICSVNLSWTIFTRKTTSRGTIPHIISNYPRAHYNAGLNTSAAVCRRRYLVSERNPSIRCACNQTKVCRRKCSGRRLPNESVPTEVLSPAASGTLYYFRKFRFCGFF